MTIIQFICTTNTRTMSTENTTFRVFTKQILHEITSFSSSSTSSLNCSFIISSPNFSFITISTSSSSSLNPSFITTVFFVYFSSLSYHHVQDYSFLISSKPIFKPIIYIVLPNYTPLRYYWKFTEIICMNH